MLKFNVQAVSVRQAFKPAGRKGASRRAIAVATTVALASMASQRVGAATQNSTWTNTSGTNVWSNAANWSPSGVPSNGTNGFSDYNISIGTTAYDDISPVIDNLTITASGNLIINPNQVLTVVGPTVTDNGTIQIDNGSGNAAFNFSGNTTITGTGSIILNDFNPNARLTSAAGVGVTLSSGVTISGVGEIDAALTNNGTVNANNYGRTLTLQTNNMSNNSLLEATGNGTLAIGAISLNQGGVAGVGGQIVANAGSVAITGTAILGGTLNNSSGSPFTLTSATLTNVAVSNGSSIVLTAGTTVNVAGTTLNNNGTVQVDTGAGNANLNFTSNLTVNGTGTIFLYNNNPRPTFNTSNGATVTLSSGQTLDGAGLVNASLVNNGTINANSYGNAMLLQTSAKTNNNVFEATGNGTLNISGITVTQGTDGVIKSDGSAVNITGANISGGTLTTPVGNFIGAANSIFANVNISTGTTIIVQPSTSLNIIGTLNNNGTIQVDNNSGNANLNFNNTLTVNGTGSIHLYNNSPSPTINTSTGATVTFSAGQTVYGEGIINASLINQGVIGANNYGQALTLQTNSMTNNKVFEATGNGTLNIIGITVAQGPSGVIQSDGSPVNITNADISSGTLTTPAGNYIGVSNSIFANVNISTGTTILIQPGTTLSVVGTLNNNGTIQVDNNSGNANLTFSNTLTLTGTGGIHLYDNNPYPTINTSSGATVTLSSGQTVYGEGIINASLINQGIIDANNYGQSLTLQTNAMTNNNIFEATGNGTLNITGITVIQGTNGIIESDAAPINITNANISGGTLTTPTNGYIGVSSSIFANVNISIGTTILVQPNMNLSIVGTLNNSGTIQVDNNSGKASLNFNNSLTVTGTGSIYLFDNRPYPTINTSTGATVTFSAGQTVYGEGIINASLINQGVIDANTYGQSLTLQTSAMTNNNLFEATNNGTLNVNGIVVTQATGAQILSVSATVNINGSNISGGSLNTSGSSIYLTSSNLSNVAITNASSVVLTAGTTVNILNSLVNNGTIQVDVNNSNANLNFLNNTNVSGTGTIYLFDNNPSPTLNTSAGATVTFGSGQLIDGEGVINARLVNSGTINANTYGQFITLQSNPMSNSGLFEANNNATLNINGIAINNSGGTISAGNGALVSIYNNANISGGTLSGSGNGYISVSNATLTNVNVATGTTVVVQPNAFLSVNGNSSNGAPILVDNGTTAFGANLTTGILQRDFTSISIGAGALATVSLASNLANRSVLATQTLAIAGNPNNWQSKLDLGNNDMDVSAGALSTINNQITQGYNNGNWNGAAGITSTAANNNPTHLTALGVIQNNQSGAALYTASNHFDGIIPGAGDILVKYTYYGDTNLDGKVDGSDYSRIDAAFLADKTNFSAVTGWYNGDFNYDGAVNGSDYTLIDNTFNTQGASLASMVNPTVEVAAEVAGGTTAVPEPAIGMCMAFCLAGLLGRQKRSVAMQRMV